MRIAFLASLLFTAASFGPSNALASEHAARGAHWSRRHNQQAAVHRRAMDDRSTPIPATGSYNPPTPRERPEADAVELQILAFERRVAVDDDEAGPAVVRRRAVKCRDRASGSLAASPTPSSIKVGVATSVAASSSKPSLSSSSSSSATAAPSSSSSTKAAAAPSPITSSSSKAPAPSPATSSSIAPAPGPTSPVALKGWTTWANTGLSKLSLSAALAPVKGKMGPMGAAPDGKEAMVANYPAGAIGGGSVWSYYSNVQPEVLQSAREVILRYSVYFPASFDWVKGGKLPGLFGGTAGTYGCSGGNQDARDICWSARLMWRAGGKGEVYTYLPQTAVNDAACIASGAGAYCKDAAYGLSFGRGNFNWNAGGWNTIEERVRLNTPGQADGSIGLTVNSAQVIQSSSVELVTRADAGFSGLFLSTFYGGSDSSWAPTSDQQAFFADFSLEVVA